MATIKLTKANEYGQLELNLVAFPRTGRVVAQYKAGESFTEGKYLENGMLLKVDGVNRTVEIGEPEKGDIYALNYSTEHMYDERVYALKDFKLNPKDDFYPRLGYLDIGDKFTTNCVCIEATPVEKETDIEAAVKAIQTAMSEGTLFGGANADGYIKLSTSSEDFVAGPVLRVIQLYTMPDGQPAVKLEVIKA
jgi:hypothetical protein